MKPGEGWNSADYPPWPPWKPARMIECLNAGLNRDGYMFVFNRTENDNIPLDDAIAEAVEKPDFIKKKRKEVALMLIPEKHQRDMLIAAFRYCLGRQSYATSTMQDVLRQAWPKLPIVDKALYNSEIKQARNNGALGDQRIDAPGWLALLELPICEPATDQESSSVDQGKNL